MTKIHYILSILLSLFVSSCISLDELSIDYLQPAKVSFPLEIKKVGVINNTTFRKDKEIKESKTIFNKLITDTIFQGNTKRATEALAENVVAANYFDEVIICDSALREKDLLPRDPELSQEEVKQLTSDLGVDMLLSVEDVIIEMKKKTEDHGNFYRKTIDATVKPVIKIYMPSRSKPLVSVYPEDKIFWEGYGRTDAEATKDLIKEDTLIKETSEFAGELPVKHILPTWNTANRYYYIGGSLELRDGGVLIREGLWDDALKLWLIANSKKSYKLKMRSAFNIALYYESHDEIEKAIEWAEKANQLVLIKEKIKELPVKEGKAMTTNNYSQDYILTTRYLMLLKERRNEIQTLNLQMKRFDDDF